MTACAETISGEVPAASGGASGTGAAGAGGTAGSGGASIATAGVCAPPTMDSPMGIPAFAFDPTLSCFENKQLAPICVTHSVQPVVNASFHLYCVVGPDGTAYGVPAHEILEITTDGWKLEDPPRRVRGPRESREGLRHDERVPRLR